MTNSQNGVFGNIAAADVSTTIRARPELVIAGGAVIWARGRKHGDPTAGIRQQFTANHFDELEFVAPADASFSVGRVRYRGPARALRTDAHLFTFLR